MTAKKRSAKRKPGTGEHSKKVRLHIFVMQGDVLNVLKKLDDNTFDGALLDPPYALTSIGKRCGKKGFMDQTWDGALPPVARQLDRQSPINKESKHRKNGRH